MTAGTKGAWYTKAKDRFLTAGIDLSSDTIKIAPIDLADEGLAITGASAASPCVITSTGHGLANGDRVQITGVSGMSGVNGTWEVANVTSNTFELSGSTATGTFAAAATGAWVIDLEKLYWGGAGGATTTIVAAAQMTVGTPLTLGSISTTGGKFDAADGVLGSVSKGSASTFTAEAFVIYVDGATPGTDDFLILVLCEGTGVPVTVNGSSINLTFPASYIARI